MTKESSKMVEITAERLNDLDRYANMLGRISNVNLIHA